MNIYTLNWTTISDDDLFYIMRHSDAEWQRRRAYRTCDMCGDTYVGTIYDDNICYICDSMEKVPIDDQLDPDIIG